jgi:hypothetical protein
MRSIGRVCARALGRRGGHLPHQDRAHTHHHATRSHGDTTACSSETETEAAPSCAGQSAPCSSSWPSSWTRPTLQRAAHAAHVKPGDSAATTRHTHAHTHLRAAQASSPAPSHRPALAAASHRKGPCCRQKGSRDATRPWAWRQQLSPRSINTHNLHSQFVLTTELTRESDDALNVERRLHLELAEATPVLQQHAERHPRVVDVAVAERR